MKFLWFRYIAQFHFFFSSIKTKKKCIPFHKVFQGIQARQVLEEKEDAQV